MSIKHVRLFAFAAASMVAVASHAQYPVMEAVANRVIQKYQGSSCEQLWQEKMQGKGRPKPPMEQRAIEALRADPQMRTQFFNMISATVVNKMFECGMLP
jgi:hypothetical protein